MKLPFAAAISAAALVLGSALSPAFAQSTPRPETATPTPSTVPPVVARPGSARGDCGWKRKNLTS